MNQARAQQTPRKTGIAAPMEQSLRLGRVAGVDIGLNWSLVVVFWLVAWSLATSRFPQQFPGYGPGLYWAAGVGAAIVFFASLLAHELGHAVVARRAGVQVDGITLWLFGGVARLRGDAVSAGAELRIAAVGPVTSFVLGGAFALVGLLLNALGAPELLAGMAWWLGVINATLAVFNLVPAFPLDGGRVLRAVLWARSKDRVKATRSAARAGRVFAYVLIALGIVEFALAAGIGGLWFVFLGWFLLGAARAEETQILLRSALRDIRVEDIMSPNPVGAPDSISIEDFIEDYAMGHRFTTFPLENTTGDVVGLVTLSRVKAVARDQRRTTSIRSVACPMEEVATARPEESAVDVLERMQACSDGRALVFDNGRLLGIVSPRDVHRALEMAGLRGPELSEVTQAARS